MLSTKLKCSLIWGYLVEPLAAILLTSALIVAVRNGLLSIEQIIKALNWCHNVCSQVVTTGAITWCVILALPFVIIAFLGDEFKDVLLKMGAVTVYVKAYIIASVLFCVTFVFTTKCEDKQCTSFFIVSVFVHIYAFINIVTVCTNAIDILWLAQKYRQINKGQT